MKIDGKTAVVAGGSGGLGTHIAASLAAAGARVAIIDRRAPEEQRPEIAFFAADLCDAESTQRTFEAVVSKLGTPHIAINCAGLIHSEPLLNLTERNRPRHALDTFNAVLASNLTAAFVFGSIAAERMALTRTKGVIVNFSSIAARGNAGQTAYAAAKAGVEAMTRVWAKELGPLGIRVSAVAPGFIATPSTHAALNDTILSDLKRRTPALRLGDPSEIVGAVVFLIENDFVTGTTLAVDGGLTL